MRRRNRIDMVVRVTAIFVVAAAGIAAYLTHDHWQSWLSPSGPVAAAESESGSAPPLKESRVVKLSPQARKNLSLTSRPVQLQSYWRTIQVPGVIVDRPGYSDRGVTSPAVGVVVQIHAFAGDTVRPGDPLFTLRLFSEYLQNTQSELFKAMRETELVKEERDRLASLAREGTIPAARLIELDQQLRRQDALTLAYRQDLLTRGLTPSQIDQIGEGRFVSTIDVAVPPFAEATRPIPESSDNADDSPIPVDNERGYEVQELKVELGQQVQAGQLLSVLSNHQSLYIEGHAFKQEAPALERAAQNGWPLEVFFAEDDSRHWPPLEQTFQIRHLANTVDRASRTFDFYVPLTNQSRDYQKDGQTFIVWRFRPGQRVRLLVPVEQFESVIVLPAAAVVREGAEAYVFRQNGDLFERFAVHVLHEDRLHVVVANDGSAAPGWYLAQSAAASLNRVLKAQASSGAPANVHVHADGTVHEH